MSHFIEAHYWFFYAFDVAFRSTLYISFAVLLVLILLQLRRTGARGFDSGEKRLAAPLLDGQFESAPPPPSLHPIVPHDTWEDTPPAPCSHCGCMDCGCEWLGYGTCTHRPW